MLNSTHLRILIYCIATFIFSGGLFIQPCLATGVSTVLEKKPQASLGLGAEYLEDPQGRLAITDVVDGHYSGRFMENKEALLRLGVPRGVVWVRFKYNPEFPPDGARHEPLILAVEKALLASVKLYAELKRDGAAAWQEIPLLQAPMVHHAPVSGNSYAFRLPSDIVPGGYLYLRLYGPGITFSIPLLLWSADKFQASQRDMGMLLGGLYGIILAMCLYNLSIFISLHDKTYLYYILWMLGALGWMAGYNGHVSAYLPVSSSIGVTVYYTSLSVSMIFAVLFTKAFLSTREHAPILDKVLTLIYAPALALAVVSLSGHNSISIYMAHFSARACAPIIVLVAVVCWIRGYKPARYVVLAWSMSVSGIVVLSLSISGVLPYNSMTFNGWSIGTALESILLAFALSDRIKLLQEEREDLQRRRYELEELSVTDELTRLYNSRYFFRRLDMLAATYSNSGDRVSCIMLDVDDFKHVNDAYGHPEGDKVLQRLGQVIRDCIRDSDIGCRYGGEEFAVILPNSGLESARAVAERVRKTFEEQKINLRSDLVHITLSAGAAQLREGEDPRKMLKRADEALYRAKRAGKNRTEVANST